MQKPWTFRSVLMAWLVCWTLFPLTVANAAEIVHALNKCPEDIPACMEMDLNMVWPLDWTDERYAQLHPNVAIESRGVLIIDASDGSGLDYVTYRISISGRLNGGKLKPYDLFFTDRGEMHCTDFVTGKVATIGFNASGEGVILTKEGVLELMNSPLRLGCEDCLALVDKESLENIPCGFPILVWARACGSCRWTDFLEKWGKVRAHAVG